MPPTVIIKREHSFLDVNNYGTRMRVPALATSGRDFDGTHNGLIARNSQVVRQQNFALNSRFLRGCRKGCHACKKRQDQIANAPTVMTCLMEILLPFSYLKR
jgi:hypothetical protein